MALVEFQGFDHQSNATDLIANAVAGDAWLWSVLTVAWNLDYRSCTNAWSVPWPRHNLKTLPPDEYWNDPIMREARQFNIDKSSKVIADDAGCRCNRCHEMMVIPLKGDYTCD